MTRLPALTDEQATGKAAELMGGVQKKLGRVPNLMRTFANSPAVLQSYLGFSTALGGGVLPAGLREQIALTVGEANDCDYCLAAHSAIGQSVGLTAEQVDEARRGTSSDDRTAAALAFAREIVETRGRVDDEAVRAVRESGFDDGEIAEIVANVALNLFTNYFNHVADTEVDFPAVHALDAVPA